MKKLLFVILLSVNVNAICTATEEKEAMSLWKSSIHQEDTQKLLTLKKAESICPDISIIKIDTKIIMAKENLTKNALKELKNLNNSLMVTLDHRIHRWNNNRKIDGLWIEFYERKKFQKGFMDVKIKNCDDNIRMLKNRAAIPFGNPKALRVVGGYYKADLLFDKDKSYIKNKTLTQDIISVLNKEIKGNPNALFALVGGASSGGTTDYNKKLSKRRAEALQKAILKNHTHYAKNLTVFAKGESQLVCEGGLFPEQNSAGEYQCETLENKEKSRRVTIRRVR